MKICPKCNFENDDDALFCENCGQSLSKTVPGSEDRLSEDKVIKDLPCSNPAQDTDLFSREYITRQMEEIRLTEAAGKFKEDTLLECPVCHSKIQDGDHFCRACGSKLRKESESIGNRGAEVICPGCQTVNPEDSFFCYKCGAPLKRQNVRSGRKKIWIALAVIAGVIVAGGSLGCLFYSNSAGQEKKVIAMEDNAMDDNESNESDEDHKNLSDFDKTEKTVKQPAEEPAKEQENKPEATPVPQDNETDSNSISLPVTPVKKEESNYSGPACAQMLLKSLGYDFSQQECARMSDADSGGPIDYRNLASAITMKIATTPIATEYTGIYLSGNEITQSAKDAFLNKLDKNLEDGFPVIIVTIVGSFSGAPEPSYGIVAGRTTDSSGQTEYRVIVPRTDRIIDIEQTTDELLDDMTILNTFCYLY